MLNQEFTQALNKALAKSRTWRGYEKHPKSMNSYRSAYFCYQAGKQLDNAIKDRFPASRLQRKQIGFDSEHKKTPGEWLLDIVWCEETCPDARSESPFPSKIFGALECESSTRAKAFFTDFAKLVHIRSRVKIFLAGVDQEHEQKMKEYIELRTRQAADFIAKTGIGSETEEWYLAFWPSPKGDVSRSLWDELDTRPNLDHLKRIYAYTLQPAAFVGI